MSDVTFTLEQAMAAQARLRSLLGLPPETFPAAAFVGMISDEIEQLRATGRSDGDIAGFIREATGKDLGVDAIARFYATPEQRHRPDEADAAGDGK